MMIQLRKDARVESTEIDLTDCSVKVRNAIGDEYACMVVDKLFGRFRVPVGLMREGSWEIVIQDPKGTLYVTPLELESKPNESKIGSSDRVLEKMLKLGAKIREQTQMGDTGSTSFAVNANVLAILVFELNEHIAAGNPPPTSWRVASWGEDQ